MQLIKTSIIGLIVVICIMVLMSLYNDYSNIFNIQHNMKVLNIGVQETRK